MITHHHHHLIILSSSYLWSPTTIIIAVTILMITHYHHHHHLIIIIILILILMITKATWKINYNYIARGTYCCIDAILAANQHSTGEYSCKGLHHNLATMLRAGTSSSSIQLGIVRFNHVDNHGMTVASNALTINSPTGNAKKQRFRR